MDWEKVKEAAEKTLGVGSYLYSEKGECALIIDPVSDKTLAIVAEGSDGGLSVAYRCSTPPNVVAILIVNLVKHFVVTLDRSFEFMKTGEAVFGPKAFRYFAENAPFILFDDLKEKVKDDSFSKDVNDTGTYKH
jgi:hypothetical protein